jgi:hypothetical protein
MAHHNAIIKTIFALHVLHFYNFIIFIIPTFQKHFHRRNTSPLAYFIIVSVSNIKSPANYFKVVYRFLYHLSLTNYNEKILPEKVTLAQLAQKFLAFHGIRRFTTMLTSPCSWILS